MNDANLKKLRRVFESSPREKPRSAGRRNSSWIAHGAVRVPCGDRIRRIFFGGGGSFDSCTPQ
jgi:hypothetical protein